MEATCLFMNWKIKWELLLLRRVHAIHPSNLAGWTLCVDSLSPRMNAIASRAGFHPIKLGESLVVNRKSALVLVHPVISARKPRIYSSDLLTVRLLALYFYPMRCSFDVAVQRLAQKVKLVSVWTFEIQSQ